MPRRFLALGAFLALTLSASGQHTTPVEPPSSASSPSTTALLADTNLAEGQRLFEMRCAVCHGPKGEGSKGPTLATPVLSRATTDTILLNIIRRGIPGSEMPSSRLRPDQVRDVAAYVRELGRLPSEPVRGDPQRGAELYTRGACAQCHSIRGHGGAIGPQLTDIGLRRSPSHLHQALVDPHAYVPIGFSAYRSDISIPSNFLQVRVVAKDGREVSGVRVNEDTFTVQVRDLAHRLHSFDKSELAEFHKDWGRSPMPSYTGVFSPAELDDLVAYLVSLKGR